jgi:O-antigen/teichoic acid export membrane protein
MSSEIAGKAVKNVFFSGGRLVISMGATLCTSAIIARMLGPANMGVYGYAMWLVGTLGILANVGLPGAITKYISEFMGSGDSTTAIRIGKRLLIAQLAIAGLVSGVTACFMLLKTPYRGIIGLAAVMLLVQALQQSLGAALAGMQRFDRLALISLYVSLVSVAAVALAAFLHAGVMGMLWATLVGLVVAIALYYRDVNKFLLRLPPRPPHLSPVVSDPFGRILKFSFTVSYILLLDSIVWQRSEVFFLKAYSTLAQIGFYTLAYSIASRLSDIANTFSTTLLPLYSESYGRHGLRDLGQVFVAALKYIQMLMVPLCFLGVAVARPLAQLIYGAQFLPVALPLQVLLVAMSVTSIGVVISPLLYGTEKQSFIAVYGTAVAALNITLDLILIPRYGALGASVANCTAQIAGVLGGAFYASRHIRASFPWKSTATIYLAAAISASPAAYLASRTYPAIAALVGAIAAGAVLYLGLLVIAGQLGKRDLDILKKALWSKASSSKPLEAADLA